MTVLALTAGGCLRGAVAANGPAHDSWAQDDETSRLSAAERARRAGAGPLIPPDVAPLVLLHAFPLSSQMWGPMVAQLPELPILMFDLPGAGASPIIEPPAVRTAALAVIESLRALGVSQAFVVGVSMGGYVAMSVLREAPDLLAGIILMHTKAVADDEAARAARLDVARRVLATGSVEELRPMASKMVSAVSQATQPDLVGMIERWIDQATPAGVAWAQEAMAGRPDSMMALRAAGLPTTIMAGAEDPFAPVSQAEAMAEAIGWHSSLVVISDVAHLSPLEASNVTARIVREAYRNAVDW
ncbi:MAG: alpha/beta hydrolase [Bifidobacteriaceae bacterium]|jgi:pimeloyl-ACP methyl ester carboxylesterase|nr:alpha/beta hydrolase [Bifidobacteriaceae bacterium]